MHFRLKGFGMSMGFVLSGALFLNVFAQETQPAATPSPSPTSAASPSPTPIPAKTPKPDKNAPIVYTPEQIAETVILLNGTRGAMAQIKRTTYERGKMATTYPDGTVENATYEKRIIRGETTEKDKIRVDLKFPSIEYAMVQNTKVFGLLNGADFSPRQEALDSFDAHIWHSFDTLFRYKENGSTLALAEKQKHMGVEYYVLDITDKNSRKTRFFISVKLFKIMGMEYTVGGVKYTRKFYDYRLAQNMLVPYRTALFVDGKQTEETWVSTVTYGQKVEEGYFQEN